ncbi:Cys-tRNA(Pro)/Cys-tRNA(Cys) deacylase YbaK [Pseudodesulfovibrio hydrargyri]|uniref:Cys-tRNA(Pro)/Cys-tRNA(Cys) deacylase n=1 Tax=Pseudodesulfovibrio hydrargyri TaxID=2125990 RepID=A0A1J5N9F6_9BACT|nr:Cys-tRNA(Pro) deacylase [Pseudodesulfovibrio hydrargyri]OIQ52251.1 Cys-tRNA(Pro)/Cys-tRNA(Cys) deacylase YbaK [Pseudodesulfovibrio hydrargyri]
MTPAINAAKKAKIKYTVHEYDHDPAAPSFGVEAAEKLGVPPGRVFKTLVVDAGGTLAVAVVPVLLKLDLKAMAKAVGAKKAAMAEVKVVERTTGYVVGGVSPLGQKKRLPTVLDASAQGLDSLFVSGGRRGLDIELAPADLAALTRASFAAIAR